MKSWADHCSSDEESLDDIADDLQAQKLADDNVAPPPPAAVDVATSAVAVEEEAAAAGPVEDAPPRVYDFPDKPPFTAFIGNLAYSLNDPEELKEAVAKCALDNLQGETINILGARISFGRDGKHRGFGYLEVETLEQVCRN
jgi:translation initiation factor 4B